MAVKLKAPIKGATWETVEVAPGDTLELLIDRPTFADVMEDAEVLSGFAERRMKKLILNWRGVQGEDGKEVPYTWETFQVMCMAYPALLGLAMVLVRSRYDRLGADESKNSEPRSEGSSSAAASTETPPSVAG